MLKMSLGEYYLFSSGGLGDIVLDYLTKPLWLQILEFKRLYDIEINVVLKTTNKFAKDIFTYNPNIKSVSFQDFATDHSGIVDQPKFEMIVSKLKVAPKRMPIYLSQAEADELQAISSESYVVMHPFAGEDFREWVHRVDLKAVIDGIIARGYRVVLIGGSHFREAKIEDQRKFRDEKFDYERDGLFNLVGRRSSRLFLSLIEKSYRFIGSSSCYLTASWCFDSKSLAVIPSHDFLPAGNWWGDVIHQKSQTVLFSELHQIDKVLDEFLKDTIEIGF